MKNPARNQPAVFAMALLAVLLFPGVLCAQVVNWTGGNGNWALGTNWSTGQVPNSGTNAVVDSGTANLATAVSGTASQLTIGESGTAAVVVGGGTLAVKNGLLLGDNAGSSGKMSVTSGSLSFAAGAEIGVTGTGAFTVNGGTVIGAGTVYVPYASGTVSGTGSLTVTSGTWNGDTAGTVNVYVGEYGKGSLLINGGYYINYATKIGYGSTGVGTGEVSSGTLQSGMFVIVGGGNGTGSLLVDGGYVLAPDSVIGDHTSSSGTATITSGTWMTTLLFDIGNEGVGVLNLQGGLSSGSYAAIGNTDITGGTNGTAGSGTVNATSGTWNLAQNIYIGTYSGIGTLNINGGLVTDISGNVGSTIFQISPLDPPSGTATPVTPHPGNGVATVTSGSWLNSGTLVVGGGISTGSFAVSIYYLKAIDYIGTGTLHVNGGYVSSAAGLIGSGSGAQGTATMDSGTWSSTGPVDVGYLSGTGTLNMNGGLLVLNGGAGGIVLGIGPGSVGTLNFGGGILSAATVTGADGTAAVNFTGTGASIFSPKLTGTLNVNQTGTGTTNLSGTETYSGTTSVNAGILLVTGSIGGSKVMKNAATLTLAHSLRVSGSYAQTAAGTLNLAINNVNSYVSVSAQGQAVLGGALNVSGANYAPGAAAGDIFTLVSSSSSLSGTFSTVNLTTLSNNLQWYVAYGSRSLVATVYLQQTLNEGTPFTLTANPPVPGSYTYQWSLNGTVIPGATNSTYSDTASGSTAGIYSVASTNGGGTVIDYYGVAYTPVVDALPGWGFVALALCATGMAMLARRRVASRA